MKTLLLAVGFLTVIPVRTSVPAPGDLGRAGMCFPLVGLGLGLLLYAAQSLLIALFPPLVTSALVVSVWAALTGGLHLDGLADSADGLFATASRERRLEILRDPRVGAFGMIALTLFLLLKVHAVAALIADVDAAQRSASGPFGVSARALPLVAATVLARWVILVSGRLPPARPDGYGRELAKGLDAGVLGTAVVVPVLVIAGGVVLGAGTAVVVAAIVAHVVACAVLILARARLGGVTGDVLGLTVELVELAVLLTFVVRW